MAFHCITAFLSGAGVLVVEMTATRALAPYFGQAQFVWANVIGLILLALAVGNFAGGRLADRRPSLALLAGLLLAAAAMVAAAAFLPGPVARAILPERLPLEAAYSFLFQGSFVATLVCFAPPVCLLGAVPPFLVRCATRRIEEVGRASGLLYAVSTLGSIAGTFLTSYVLVPALGTRGTLLLAAGLLAAAAVPAWIGARSGGNAGTKLRTVGVAVALVATAAALGPLAWSPSVRAAVPGAAWGRFVAAIDSPYQHIEVRERQDFVPPARVLAIDEGHDSFQSVTPSEGLLTGGLYYDYLTALAMDSARGGRLDVAILGFGAGTHARQILGLLGRDVKLSVVGVELDPLVVAIARKELGLRDDPRLVVHTGLDARTFVDHSPDQFDLLLVDCYSRQSFLPPHVASREFFAAAKARLREGGCIALNLSGYGARDPVVESVTNTLAVAFGSDVAVCALPGTINFLVVASNAGTPRLPQAWDTSGWPAELAELARRIAAPAQSFLVEPRSDRLVLTDDGGALDRLQEERLRRRARAVLESVGDARPSP